MLYANDDINYLDRIQETEVIGTDDSSPSRWQVLHAIRDRAVVFTSCLTTNYRSAYRGKGVLFQTEERPIYACPTDTWTLLYENDKFIPGVGEFLFESIDEMLMAFPSPGHFKQGLKKLLKKTSVMELYPGDRRARDKKDELLRSLDDPMWMGRNCHNEIVFESPIKVEVLGRYDCTEELRTLLDEMF